MTATLSVVVPIYNVAAYLPSALDSLARQTLRDLEVVMVDDGSTDQSPEVAGQFAARDPRFRLVRQENSGLGHARNTGARLATGAFLAFADSDDLVPHYAYTMAVRTLETTGSDFLSGNEYQFDARGARPAAMLERNFAVTKLRTNVTQVPSLMRDLLPHNKVYRRSFWDSAGLEFPEGILFEDGPVSVRAHALAESVDVVATPIYYWRVREEGSRSLTQLVDDERYFVDRIGASTLTADFLAAHRPELLGAFFQWDMAHKFPVMYRALPRAPAEVRARFLEAAVPHLQRVPDKVIRGLPPQLRRLVRITLTGDPEELRRALPPASGPPSGWRGHDSGLRRALSVARRALGTSRSLQVARAYLRAAPSGGAVDSTVTTLEVTGDRLRLAGYGQVAGLPADGLLTAANRVLWARHQESGRRVRLRLRSRRSPAATAAATGPHFGQGRAGFAATLPLARLRDGAGRWQYGTWVLALGSVTPRGLVRYGLGAGSGPDRFAAGGFRLDERTVLVPVVANGVLGLRVERRVAAVAAARVVGDGLELTGRSAPGAVPADARLALGRVDGVAELSMPVTWSGDDRFTATVPLSEVLSLARPVAPAPPAGYPDRFHIGLATTGRPETWLPLAGDPGMAGAATTVTGHPVTVRPTPDARLCITVHPPVPMVTSAAWTPDGTLVLRGTDGGSPGEYRVAARHADHRELRLLPHATGPRGAWEVRIDPERVPAPGGPAALPSGRWRLILRSTTGNTGPCETDLPSHPAVWDGPAGIGHRDHLLAPAAPEGLALWVGSRLRAADRGRYHAHRLRRDYRRAARRTPLREVVLYDSFGGRQYSDAPRAVYEALAGRDLGLTHLWVTRDAQAPAPAGVATVESGSSEWFEALATSRYLVANSHLRRWFRRRPGQVVAQTWHGIGFKKVAFDLPGIRFANQGYLAALAEEAPNWSFLVSPSRFCTGILRRAFRYQGEVCEIGSPRNDLLITGDRSAITDRVRRSLGLPDDRRILLYAPTWRDDQYDDRGRYRFTMRLDTGAFPDDLRDKYVLLTRTHPNVVDGLPERSGGFVVDATGYPDASHLLAAADVLVTDYSTIALDFLNTGRPVLFYAYDLADYRDRLRGFYFDLEREGPGPVLRTTAEVVAALRDIDMVAGRYAERYRRFQEIFCHAEDGRATDRFIKRLLRDHPRP